MNKPTLDEIADTHDIANRDHFKQQLTQLIADIINTQKDIYLKNDLPSMLATDDYIKTREELRAEQRQRAKERGINL